MKVYCDTNVFIDYFREREDSLRPLSDLAFDFFARGWNCAYHLVVSDWLVEELGRHVEEEKIDVLFSYFEEEEKLEWVYLNTDLRKMAEEHEQVGDARHALLALEAGCDKLATRNLPDFADFSGKLDIALPESI